LVTKEKHRKLRKRINRNKQTTKEEETQLQGIKGIRIGMRGAACGYRNEGEGCQ